MRKEINYYIVDAKSKVIETFRTVWAARIFKSKHNKDYFRELRLLTAEEYEKEIKNKK